MAMAVPEDGVLKAREAAAMLRSGHTKFYELVRTGAFPVIKIGTSICVAKRDILEYIEKRTTGGWKQDDE
jgi:excisionase family DNA binding protein